MQNRQIKNTVTILVIEDNDDVRALLKFFLVREGFNVEFAINGEQAIQKIQSDNTPSLILLDIMMPFCDGFEILQQLKSNTNWKNIPVIMLSAHDNEENISRGIELGASDFLSKPFDPEITINKIKHLLGNPE